MSAATVPAFATKAADTFRVYVKADDAAAEAALTPQQRAVRAHYRDLREKQTLAYVRRMHDKCSTFTRSMSCWDVLEKLRHFIDVSDPDVSVPNVFHLFQTAEGLRRDGFPEWLQLVGLLHDAGKIIHQWGEDDDGTTVAHQWGVVGDTFVVGCQIPDVVVHPEFNGLNPDTKDPVMSTELGIYTANCGLDNCLMSWGHDEYMFKVLTAHKQCTIPAEGLYVLRYHSLYPWHTGGAYRHLMNEWDHKMLPLVLAFNKYDLYTKANVQTDFSHLHDYYQGLMDKYLGGDVLLW